MASMCSLMSLASPGRLDFVNNKEILESFKQRDHVMEYCIGGGCIGGNTDNELTGGRGW